MKLRHREEHYSLCCSHYLAEMELELSHGPTLRARLEQLLAAAKDARIARLNRLHDSEVGELKKKLDAQNWEEMKALAKRHRDKNELARYGNSSTCGMRDGDCRLQQSTLMYVNALCVTLPEYNNACLRLQINFSC
jgi:hypothetical protein